MMRRGASRADFADTAEKYRSAAEIVGGFAYALRFPQSDAALLEWCGENALYRRIGKNPGAGMFPDFLGAVHPDDAKALELHLSRLAEGIADEIELRFRLDDDSSWIWLRLRADPVASDAEDGSSAAFGMAEDETERSAKRHELEINSREHEKELSALLEISHNMASTLELEPLLSLILSELKKIVDYTGASILRPEGDELVMLEYRGPMIRDQAMRLRIPIARSHGYQKILAERVPVIISDVIQDSPGTTPFQRSVQQFRPFFGYAYSVLLTPLIVKDRLIGVLRLDHRERGHFTERHATLALAVANHAAVAVENAQLYERAQRLAKMEERQRIARELHDSVSQSLYGIRLGAQTAIELHERQPEKAAESLIYVRDLAEAGMKEMRALLYELRPEAIASEGLVSGLNKMISSIQARYGLEIRQELCAEPPISAESKDALYRIAQEALHNVVKHAKAKTVLIRLSQGEASITLEILDDGKGFAPEHVAPDRMGLLSISERAFKLGGVLDVETAPGEGTQIRVIIPLGEDAN